MAKIADNVGADATHAKLLRLTNNAVFAMPADGIVIRISRSRQFHDRAVKVANLGAWFTETDAPTIRLAAVARQPIIAEGLAATIWQYIPPSDVPVAIPDLADALRSFHHLGEPPFAMPAWDPVGDARRRVDDAEGLADEERELIVNWCERLEPEVALLRASQPKTLIHGDAHVGNLLRDTAGQALLCDFDATCLGPWQVDLAAVAVGDIRFGRKGASRELAAACGYDVTEDVAWPVLRGARELKMVAAAVPLLQSGRGVAEEFRKRLRSATSHDEAERWTPFADLGASHHA